MLLRGTQRSAPTTQEDWSFPPNHCRSSRCLFLAPRQATPLSRQPARTHNTQRPLLGTVSPVKTLRSSGCCTALYGVCPTASGGPSPRDTVSVSCCGATVPRALPVSLLQEERGRSLCHGPLMFKIDVAVAHVRQYLGGRWDGWQGQLKGDRGETQDLKAYITCVTCAS